MCYAVPERETKTTLYPTGAVKSDNNKPWKYTCQGIDPSYNDTVACCYNTNKGSHGEFECCPKGCGKAGTGCRGDSIFHGGL